MPRSVSVRRDNKRRGVLTLLNLRFSADKVVKTLCARLCAVGGKCEIVVLEVETDSRQVNFAFDARSLELLGIANSRALKDEWRRQRAT